MDTLKVSRRDFDVKAKKLRREGKVPASVCGGLLKDSVSLQIDASQAKKILGTKHIGARLQLDLDGKKIPVQLKQRDFDVVDNSLLNVGFQALAADQKVKSIISIELKNANKVDALIEQIMMDIPYESLPADMIDVIEVDLDGKTAGTTITVADIPELKSDKLTLAVNDDEVILKIIDKKRLGSAEETEETTEE